MDCSGFTHGPPLWLHPGQLNRPTSISSSVAVLNMVCIIFHHLPVNIFTGPVGVPCPSPIIPICTRLIPTFFMAWRSFTTPFSEMFPSIQYQYTASGWSFGVSMNVFCILSNPSAQTCWPERKVAMAANEATMILFMFIQCYFTKVNESIRNSSLSSDSWPLYSIQME